jgi:hypothetical protein
MANGPKGEQRPDDPAAAAVAAIQIATGGRDEKFSDEPHVKDPAAVSLGRRGGLKGGLKGGHARAEKLSPERRKEIARLAAKARHKG